MTNWFFMLGEPLSEPERELARGYLNGLHLDGTIPIESVATFESAAKISADPDWDRGVWDAEQRERQRLRARLASTSSSEQLWQSLSYGVEAAIDAPHDAAATQAARLGCDDAALIRAAAGALGEALHLARLAELSGETHFHPFSLKKALFAGGHWPLAVVSGRYYVF